MRVQILLKETILGKIRYYDTVSNGYNSAWIDKPHQKRSENVWAISVMRVSAYQCKSSKILLVLHSKVEFEWYLDIEQIFNVKNKSDQFWVGSDIDVFVYMKIQVIWDQEKCVESQGFAWLLSQVAKAGRLIDTRVAVSFASRSWKGDWWRCTVWNRTDGTNSSVL